MQKEKIILLLLLLFHKGLEVKGTQVKDQVTCAGTVYALC